MQLVLVPPTSLPVPLRLQTHDVPTPVIDTQLDQLRVPRGFLVARKALKNVGLEQKNYLAFDSSAWWQVVVRSVEWNLEDEVVVVTLVDGTEERWELGDDGGRPRSAALVDNEDGTSTSDGQGDPQDGDVEMRDGTTARNASPWAPAPVLEHLRALCIDLRSAYEDLGMVREYDNRALDIDADDDWSMLQDLSADHDMDVPLALSDAQSYFEYAMNGFDEDDNSSASQGRTSTSRRARRPSQAASVDGDADSLKFTGQFVPQYRDRSSKTSLAVDEPSRQHDYLSMIHLLARIRAYLADQFSRVVIPKLRDALPVTYTLWDASGAIAWCRREAIRLGGDVARLMLDLLEDDGDVFDADSDSEPSPPDILVLDEGDEHSLSPSFIGNASSSSRDGLSGLGGVYDELAEWRAEERRIQRLSQNVLVSLQGDYELRRWCEAALERARTFAQGDGLVETAPPRWTEPVPSQEVSHTLDGDEGDLNEPPSKRSSEYQIPLALRPRTLSSAPASPPTSPPPETTSPARKRACSIGESVGSDDSTEGGSSDDSEDEDDLDSFMRYQTEFFYPEDPLDEEFLPSRLPKELVRASASRGVEMEEHRARVHKLLNKINGLQHKIVELQDFVASEAARWETNLEEARKPKEPTPRIPSGLSSTGPSDGSPPVPAATKTPVPLKAQPLRKQAGDRALALSLDSALDALRSPFRPEALGPVKVPTVHMQSAAPRRKQKSNLEMYVKVVAMSRSIQAATPPRSRVESSGQKKRKRPKGPSAGVHASHAPGRSPTKRPRVKLVQREGASADLSSLASGSAQQVFGSSTAATPSAAGARAQDPRHLAALELSNRRRGAVAAASARMPSAWAEDEEHEEEDEVDDRSSGSDDESEGDDPAPARSSMRETSKYWDESDSSDDEGLELFDLGAVTRSRDDSPDPPTSSPSPDMRPDSPYYDEYEAPTRPGTAAVSSPILLAPSLLVLPNLGPLFPLSAERSALNARSTSPVNVDGAGGGPPSPDDEPFLFAPRPRRPTFSNLVPAPPARADTFDIASSPFSSPPDTSSAPAPAAETGLAQRMRDRLACVSDPPVQLVPPLSLDWPADGAEWDGSDGYELVLVLDVGDDDGGV
ncbi:hypothetical protein JCM3775_007411 [Rhodotorula graminis]